MSSELARTPNVQIFLFHGDAHLTGKTHLADMVDRAFPGKSVLFQVHMDAMYWDLRARALVPSPSLYVKLGGSSVEETFYLHVAPPSSSYAVEPLAWISLNVTRRADLTRQLDQRATVVANDYEALIEALERGDLNAAETSYAAFHDEISTWAELALGAHDDPLQLLESVGADIGALKL